MRDIIEKLISHPDFKEMLYWERIAVEKDAKVISEGEAGGAFYFVEQGTLRVLGKVCLGGDKSVSPGVYDMNSGNVVGELVLFDKQPRSATVRALEPSILIQFDAPRTMLFLQEHPDLGFEFMRELMSIMVGRLRSSNQKVFSLLAWGLKAHGIEKEL